MATDEEYDAQLIASQRAEIERLRSGHYEIIRRVQVRNPATLGPDRVMLDPPEWTKFTEEQLKWIS